MTTKDFDPGPLGDARVEPAEDGGWTLILVRELRHPRAAVWTALTDPAQVDRWAPFAAARDLGVRGETTVTVIDGDTRVDVPATVLRAEEPSVLEYTWGGDLLRWELEPAGAGTRLTLRHRLSDPDTRAMVAAGWHICLGVLDRLLAGDPVGAIRGREAMDHGWEKLRDGYAERFAAG